MDITIRGRRSAADVTSDGRYYKTFTPQSERDLIQIHPLADCVGDTKLIEIQLEKGSTITKFVEPKETVSPLSGILKDLRNLNLELKSPQSELWGKIRTSNEGMVKEYFSKASQSIVAQTASQFTTQIKDMKNNFTELTQRVDGFDSRTQSLAGEISKIKTTASSIEASVATLNKRSTVTVNDSGIHFGSGANVNGDKLASMLYISPTGIDLISSKIRARGDLMVDGSITGRKVAANTITGGNIVGGTITGQHLQANSIEGRHMKVDNAMIDKLLANDAIITKLFAKRAMINELQSIQIQATQISANLLKGYTGEIGGFRIGRNPNDGGLWLTGTNNFRIGMAQGAGDYNDNAAAIWAGWSDNWNDPGSHAWWVTRGGTMHARKEIRLYNGAKIVGGNLTYSNGTYVYSKNVKSMEFSYQESSEGNDWMYFSVGNVGPYDDAHLKYYVKLTYSTSDRRFKHAIKPTGINGLEAIRNLKCYEYDQTLENGHERHIDCGIMAQDVKKYASDAHSILPSGRERYEPFELIPYLIKAIQELDLKNKLLEEKLAQV